MDQLFWIGFVGAIIAGLFAVTQAKKVMTYSEGIGKELAPQGFFRFFR